MKISSTLYSFTSYSVPVAILAAYLSMVITPALSKKTIPGSLYLSVASDALTVAGPMLYFHLYLFLILRCPCRIRFLSSLLMRLLKIMRKCTKTSYRDATAIPNRFLGRTDINTIKLRTLSDSICRIGAEISEELSNVTEHISAGKQSFLPGTRLPDRWCTGSREPYPVSLSIPSLYGHP